MLTRIRNSGPMLFATALMMALPGGGALAQLTDDPAALPWPDLTATDPNRAVVISITFNSPTEVVVDDVMVSNARARSSLGAPLQILLELLDQDGAVLAQQNDWHPLWVRDLNEGDGERSPVTTMGPGTFFVPLDEDLHSVRIIDTELEMELITVDVSGPVDVFCGLAPTPPLCSLFKSGFE